MAQSYEKDLYQCHPFVYIWHILEVFMASNVPKYTCKSSQHNAHETHSNFVMILYSSINCYGLFYALYIQ